MRVTSPSPAAVSRPSPQTLTAKPTVETRPAAQLKPLPGRPIVDFFQPDARSRATQGEQLGQIADGVRNGSITEQESATLLEEQQAIADAQEAAMADGKLSLAEKVKLAVMQAQANRNIESATQNGDRDLFAPFDQDAQTQANQIDQIAAGRTTGNITNSEAGKLLGQQASISEARGSSGPLGQFVTDMKQREAQQDIHLHGKPGTQLDLGDIRPLPFPRLPRPELPKIELPVFRANHIVG